jgi:hypothetical protein
MFRDEVWSPTKSWEKSRGSLMNTVLVTLDQPFGSRTGYAALATDWLDEHR